ncbi:MAG: Cytochrome c biogenesis protein [Parcubacteria group bacterium GW2011_GWA1_44_13]|uniref:Cytochrome c biogenesis protein n=1 Tax=Candidatus Nomurabacteria bacterium GW2011_GWB1_44_12 TaxID=1618748 RepID=A0A837III9_9BACT|nr:MAG: Cytochrome c biogenesis protein [Candidatus Nomurabacteria bacterium GW2011_GWB1_44_12]KKT37742.1 MAG: Cytochrome c biogenesis protein [Parcubacteria group bacterium GW2011_GWA1_44_13]HBB43969.1 cytochrome C biogenesis protein [Candidatus Yonathbacteria bacterium]
MTDVTIIVAFGAGVVSFFAPCVLPLVPGFIAYLGGIALEKKTPDALVSRFAMFHASLFFVLGFTTVFAVLGLVLHSALVQAGPELQTILARAGGAIVIFFGLYLMGLVKLSFLERPHIFKVHKKFSSRALTSFVFGSAFAMGWTPCVGAALGAILGLAVLAPAKTFFLLVAYALGLGAPFLIIGAFAGEIEKYLSRSFAWMQYVNILFGGVLVWFGALAFTQNLSICREVLWSFPF